MCTEKPSLSGLPATWLPFPQASDTTSFQDASEGVPYGYELACTCLLVRLYVSPLSHISYGTILTLLHVLPEHFTPWELASHNPETTTTNIPVCLWAPQRMCYTLKKKKETSISCYTYFLITCCSVLLLKMLYVFFIICNVCLVFK